MKLIAAIVGTFFSVAVLGEEPMQLHQGPSVEILGVKVTRGMSEAEVRAALPDLICEQDPAEPGLAYCSVSSGDLPADDGEIKLENGYVDSATRNWFIPEDANPLEVLMLVHKILERLVGTDKAACGKIATWSFQDPYYTIISLPDKYVAFQLHRRDGEVVAGLIKESLRVNPVPSHYKTQGDIMRGTEWCAYVN